MPKTIKVYTDEDANPELVRGKPVAIIGYGSQGRAHAMNLKDSGCEVIVGLRDGSPTAAKARADGLTVMPVAEAAKAASLVALLTPDMSHEAIFASEIAPNLEQGDAMSSLDLADYTGLYGEEVDALTEEQRRELTTIFDPVYQERMEAEMAAMTDMMERVFGSLEPGLREGLSRALATRFSTDELEAINAFFATPAGAKYAGESLIMFTDPQIMASVGQAMPALMQEMPALFGGEGDTAGDLPSPRRYDDLTPSEQRRAAELLGVDQPTLRARMAEAEEAKAEEAGAAGGAPADDAWSDDDQAIPDVETEETSDAFEEAMEEVGA